MTASLLAPAPLLINRASPSFQPKRAAPFRAVRPAARSLPRQIRRPVKCAAAEGEAPGGKDIVTPPLVAAFSGPTIGAFSAASFIILGFAIATVSGAVPNNPVIRDNNIPSSGDKRPAAQGGAEAARFQAKGGKSLQSAGYPKSSAQSPALQDGPTDALANTNAPQ